MVEKKKGNILAAALPNRFKAYSPPEWYKLMPFTVEAISSLVIQIILIVEQIPY